MANKLFCVSGILWGGGAAMLMPGGTPVYYSCHDHAVASSPEDAIDRVFGQYQNRLKEYEEAKSTIQQAKNEEAAVEWLKENPHKKRLLEFAPAEPVKKEEWRAKEVQVPDYDLIPVRKEK